MDTPSRETHEGRKRILDPVERISEILFGLIMALTFTGSLSVGDVGSNDVRTMLIGALACNLAWGLVDAVMYLLSNLTQSAHGLLRFRRVREARDPQDADRIIAEALPPGLASALTPSDFAAIRGKLRALTNLPVRPRLGKDDWLGALGVFALVFTSTFPVVIPFLFMRDPWLALRVSNGIALVMLFLCGYGLGRYAGFRRWRSGFVMVLLGVALVGATMALGG